MVSVSPRPILVKAPPRGSPASPASPGISSPPPIAGKPSPGGKPPAVAAKPAASSQSIAPTPAKLSVSKYYVIPPRPKPGRKPSTEVPPSRRKAQNREAQRAFRERKSQAVRALEDQLAQQAREFEKQQQLMKDQIAALQRQTQAQGPAPAGDKSYSASARLSPQPAPPADLRALSPQAMSSQAMSPHAMSPHAMSPHAMSPHAMSPNAMSPLQPMTPQPLSPQPVSFGALGSPLPPPPGYVLSPQGMSPQGMSPPSQMAMYAPSPSIYLVSSPVQPQTPPAGHHSHASAVTSPGSPFGPGVTTADVVGLELLDHVLEQKLPTHGAGSEDAGPKSPGPKTPMARRLSRSKKSPETPQAPGVVRTDPPLTANPLELVNTTWSQPAVPLRRRNRALEVDYTSAFLSSSPRTPKPFVYLPTPAQVRDRCGFCTDNTPCICAESAAREQNSDLAPDLATLGSPLGGQSLGSPLGLGSSPSGGAAAGSSLANGHPLGSGSSGSLSAGSPLRHSEEIGTGSGSSASSSGGQDSGACTGNPSNCSQCQHDPMLTLFCSAVSNKPPAAKPPHLGTYIPAQAAYKTLSRHPGFAHADLGEVVNSLLVMSLQVEVNSVAKVLRMLDTQVR